jgi:regulator of sigma E protease
MVDESMDPEYSNEEPKEYEFRSKNTFQKAFVLSAGVIMNFILAVLIFTGIRFFQDEYRSITNEISFVHEKSLANSIGLLEFDKILEVNGKKTNYWEDVIYSLTLENFGDDLHLIVERDSKQIEFDLNQSDITKLLTDNNKLESGINKAIGIEPANCVVVINDVLTLEPAGRAGIQANDTLISINNIYLTSASQMIKIINDSEGTLLLKLKRGARVLNTFVTPSPDTKKIGVYPQTVYLGELERVEYGFGESISYGYKQSVGLIGLIVTSFGEIFSGNIEFDKAVGGPIMIAKQSAKTAEMGLISFLIFIANLSISLALINILPIPALDGGHLIVVLIEGITRRELSTKIKIIVQNVGMAVLFLFLIFVIYKDIMR